MARLSRAQTRLHDAACALLSREGRLTVDQIHEVLENWHEGANHANARTGAHFTPVGLAQDMAIEAGGRRVVDLCAGIGTLSYAAWQHAWPWASGDIEGQENYTLVEINEDYAAVARRIMPGAEVIVGSVFDPVLIAELRSRNFDLAISNPPYGTYNSASGRGPRYEGSDCHYAVIDVASEVARHGLFLIPQAATPFQFSGHNGMTLTDVPSYEAFSRRTGIEFEFNCGIDTARHRKDWRDVSVTVEIVHADFVKAAARRRDMALAADARAAAPRHSAQFSMFDVAA